MFDIKKKSRKMGLDFYNVILLCFDNFDSYAKVTFS